MKTRTKKFLSLFLASAMVLTMNTFAFGGEKKTSDGMASILSSETQEQGAIDGAKDGETDGYNDGHDSGFYGYHYYDPNAEKETEDVDYDNAYNNAYREAYEEAWSIGYRDGVEDKANQPYIIADDGGITFDKDGKPVTTITYEADPGNKKSKINNIVKITDTTDPVSWNNAYGANLIYTVLFGNDTEDEYLNNSSPVAVSKNGATIYMPKGLREDPGSYKYRVIPVKAGEAYLLMAYWLNDDDNQRNACVAGHDDAVATVDGATQPATIPVTTWDGRTIDFNKSGLSKFAKGKKEALNIRLALVTYASGTVTELPGVTVGSVKVDKKTQKNASVAYATTKVDKPYMYRAGGKLESDTTKIDEHAALSELPFFTISAKVKGNDAKTYKKDIATALKAESEKYYFGIVQKTVQIDSLWNGDDEITQIFRDYGYKAEQDAKTKQWTYTVSAGDAKTVEEKIAKRLLDGAYVDHDEASVIVDGIGISKFNGKKANVTVRGIMGDAKKGYDGGDVATLKDGTDYKFDAGSLAGKDVSVLDFTGTNVIYRPMQTTYVGSDENFNPIYGLTMDGLASLGYKYAFRMSPVEGSKLFRHGLYKDTNIGFVFSED